MPNIVRNFIAGKMNKSSDERLVPNGEYIHAQNIRLNSTEAAEKGVVENAIGNTQLTTIEYNGTPLSADARTIGAVGDGARENIYWFVHDPSFSVGATGKLDLILSYNTLNNTIRYHVVSIDDNSGVNTTLNFNPQYLITGINIIDDLLFFTDDFNPPRVINIKATYPTPSLNIDRVFAKDLMVLKQPPLVPLQVTPIRTANQDNYLQERFISFAYRYRYANNEYSATTEFTNPIFISEGFSFTASSFLNEGMVNRFNACIISYNTGGDDVVGIDLLFKESGRNIIRIIEKIDKKGPISNTTQTYTFSNQKIFTILPESEILRLYDNVPRYALAQTIMGNRLVYGNYTEGYNLTDDQSQELRLEYEVDLISSPLGFEALPTSTDIGVYGYGGGNTGLAQNVGIVNFNQVAGKLNAGASISINITFRHAFFNASASQPVQKTGETTVNISYALPVSYNSVFELATSPEFQLLIGLPADIQTVPNACNGVRFTDQLNCIIPNNLNAFVKQASGIDNAGDPVFILANPSSDSIGFQLIAMEYQDNVNSDIAYEFYEITDINATFQEIGDNSSLHSNRGYEVGIVYMDEFKRATTVLTSSQNNLYIPCEFSDNKNQIQVTIPFTQRPPLWATHYKFAIKTDKHGYNTVYSILFVREPATNYVHFLLDGENARKVEVGDRLFIKADTSGVMRRCTSVVVLEKVAREKDFLGNTVPSPPGVYMKLAANDFSAIIDPDDIIDFGTREARTERGQGGQFPILRYPVCLEDPNNVGQFIDYTIPAGSRIEFNYEFRRDGAGITNSCERRIYTLKKTLISTGNYASFEAWFNGDNVKSILNDGTSDVEGGGQIFNVYITPTATNQNDIPRELGTNFWRFFRDPATNLLSLMATGTRSCTGVTSLDKRISSVRGSIKVFRADNVVIFETEAQDTLPDVYYEGSQVFEIDQSRQHLGNIQNQDYITQAPAIILTNFMNCFTFGNGAESYKIRDSIVGKEFDLGNRVMAVANQDYKEARRFADLTYSGVYNDETNVNKFNEFNLGLLNFKQLERRFGPVYILDGRQTDIRVLQEDKISYVLAGKNLISDSVEGGVISSIPEVLGTQIARIEEIGISQNPESYVKWGDSAYFTDAKRGSVVLLKGADRGEQLGIISDMGMDTWFRDMFIEKFTTQKIGGYDPYMDEYVLTANNIQKPIEVDCIGCGQSITYTVNAGESIEYCVNVLNTVGLVSVVYSVVGVGGTIELTATYDGNDYGDGETTTSGSFELPKDSISDNTINIKIEGILGTTTINVLVNCPTPQIINVVQVSVNNDADAGSLIYNQYRYTDVPFVSPIQSNLIQFLSGISPIVSQYAIITGAQGLGAIPTNGSTVRMISNKGDIGNFNFLPTANRLRYLRTNTVYPNTPTGITNLLAAVSNATPILGGGGLYYAEFTMPTGGLYLYLVWDYRSAYEVDICSDTQPSRALCCCSCEPDF